MSRSTSATSNVPDSAQRQRMCWTALLCAERLYPKQRNTSKDRTAFEVDYDRLIFSKAFRRLARKTQVHPLAVNDHTHNRLTHSLEVASVGRSLGKSAYRIACKRETTSIPATANDFGELVQAACLAHDVGNTPFGHAGERAIRYWMNSNSDAIANLSHAQNSDFTLYEGNAQAFRIATRSISESEDGCDNKQGGLGLTAATLATMMKYPWHSNHPQALPEGKYSVFQSETAAFEWVVNSTGLISHKDAYCRHPLTFLVEAADDICNAIIDIEDAIDLHILTRDVVEVGLMQLSGLQTNNSIAQMRATAIGNLIRQCLQVFDKHYEAIMLGQHQAPLIDGIDERFLEAFNELNKIARHQVYPFQQDASMEQDCFAVFNAILTSLTTSTAMPTDKTPDYIFGPYAEFTERMTNQSGSEYEKLMCTMDFVAGMTDNYAVNLSALLNSQSTEAN